MRLVDAYFAPAPASRLAIARLLVGGYATAQVARRMPRLTSFVHFDPEGFRPVGVVALLEAPLDPALTVALPWLALLAGLFFTAGLVFRASGPIFAALFTWVMAYRCSWGMVFHTESLVCLHLWVLAVVPAAAALSMDARRGRAASAARDDERFGWPLRLLAVLTVLTYFVSGLTKVETSGFGWAEGELLRNYVAFDALRKVELGSFHSPVSPALLGYPSLFTPMAACALALELGAPLALLHRRVAGAWMLGIWLFHLGVWLVMGIGFAYPLTGLAFVGFFPLERVAGRVAELRRDVAAT